MNKHGWGLRKELAFVLLFVFCLLVSMIGLSQFGLTEDKNISKSYKSMENELTSAALRYYKEKYNGYGSDTVVIKLETLKNNGYISSFKDSNGVSCNGYTKVINSDVALSYIRCFGYKTTGYEEEYE